MNELFFANNRREMLSENTYEKLRIFFSNCSTPSDFYIRINESIVDLNETDTSQHDLYGWDLSEIVDMALNKEDPILWCHQQATLFAAGVKAMFSHYDEQIGRFVLNDDVGDFKLEMWRSFSLVPPIAPYRSHRTLVIDIWNGEDYFLIDEEFVDKIEVDTSADDPIREWDKRNDCLLYPFLGAKLNSFLYTTESRLN